MFLRRASRPCSPLALCTSWIGLASVAEVGDKALGLCGAGGLGCQASAVNGMCSQSGMLRKSFIVFVQVAMDTGTALMMGPRRAVLALGMRSHVARNAAARKNGGAVGMPMPRSASSSTPWETASSQGPACDVRHVKLHVGHRFSCTGSSSYLVCHFTRERSCTSFCPPQPGEVGDRFGSPCHTLEVARCLRILE